MFLDTADPALVERVATGMSAAPPDIALSALEEGRSYGRELQQGLRELRARKIAINARPKPTDAEAQTYGIEIMRMSGVGHFLMMEDPETFNRLLAQAVEKCVRYTTAR